MHFERLQARCNQAKQEHEPGAKVMWTFEIDEFLEKSLSFWLGAAV
jgi:hypothetical protein